MSELIFKIAKINNLLPIGFEDRLVLTSYDYPQAQGKFNEREIKQVWNGKEYDIQDTIYDQYKFSFWLQSPVIEGVFLSKYSKRLKIVYPDGTEKNIEVIEISDPEKIEGSSIYQIDMTFKDLDSEKVIKYWDYSIDPDFFDNPVTLRLQNSKYISDEFSNLIGTDGYKDYFSIYPALLNTSDQEDTESEAFGVIKPIRTDIFDQVSILMMLNEEDSRIVNKYLPLCDEAQVLYKLGTYQKIDIVEKDVSNIDVDLYSSQFTIKYQVLNNYPYSNNQIQ